MTLSSSSKPDTKSDGGPQGYFTGDVDTLNEPLLFREPPLQVGPAAGITEVSSKKIEQRQRAITLPG
jgi:hypothetical protein